MPDYPFKNLIFEGGGVKGIAYVGAMEELDKRAIVQNIKERRDFCRSYKCPSIRAELFKSGCKTNSRYS